MPLLLTCPCKQKLKVSDDKRGKNIKCPACQRILKIPERKAETKTDDSLWGTLPETQSIQPTPSGRNYNALKPSKMQAQKKTKGLSGRNLVLVLSGLGACVALAGIAGIAFWLSSGGNTKKVSETSLSPKTEVASNPGTTSSQSVESKSRQSNEPNESGGFVPSIPNAVLKWPKPVLENAAFDILKFVEAPPANENAAPLYLDALFEFDPKLEACFVGSPNLAARLTSVNERVKLRKVFDKPYSTENAAEWKSTLKLYDEGFTKMVLAQKRAKCMFQSDFSIFSRSLQADAAFWFGKIATYRSTIYLKEGDFATPLQTVEMLLRLSRDVRNPNKSTYAINNEHDENAAGIVREMFLTPRLKPEHCDQLLSILDRHIQEVADNTLLTLRGYYVIQRLFVYELMTKTGYFSVDRRRKIAVGGSMGDDSAESIFAWFAYTGLLNPKRPQGNERRDLDLLKNAALSTDLKREYGVIDGLFQKNSGMATRSFAEQWSETYYSRDSIYKENISNGVELDMSKFFLARPATLWDRFAVYGITEARTKLNALKVLVSLRKWQLNHNGSIPNSLDEVMKESGDPVLPIDAFSNKPLLYTVLNGKPVVYSVGPNGIDEQAKIEASFDLSLDVWYLKATPMQSPGDFVFRIGN